MFFSLQIKLLLCNQISLDASAVIEKVSTKTEESKGLRPTIQKDEKSALFCNSVNSVISSSKFSFEEKDYLKRIISFNFSNKKFMQKVTDQRLFDFFPF